jgi:hypothetical protein
MPDFDALFAPDESSGPDFTSLFAPDEKTPFRPELALKNAPKSAFNTARRVAADILPGQHVQTGFALAQPGGLSNAWEGLKERFGGVENIKRTAEEDPVGLAYDATGLIGGGKGLSVAKAAPSAMPRNVVREGAELLSTGGKRMTEAKLNPATVAANDIAAPMQKFRDKLKTEAAIDLNTADLAPALKNRITRIEGAYAPAKRDPMASLTGTKPATKSPITLAELHGHSKGLDTFINSTGKTEGRINEQGFIALELKNTVDEMIGLHPESGTFKVGKHEYHRGAMNRDLEQIRTEASRTRTSRNGNEVDALQDAVGRFLNKKSNRHKFSPAIRAKLEKFMHDKKGRLTSKFAPNTLGGQTFARGFEAAIGIWPGTLQAPAHMIKQARAARLMKEFEDIMAEVRAGEPVGK